MKKSKLILAAVLLMLGVYTYTPAIYANNTSDIVVNLCIDNPVMEVNGIKTPIDEDGGTKPTIIDGRTLVPIRAIIESFNGTVGWDQNTQTVSLKMEDDTITLTINNTVAYLNDTPYTLDVAPCVINERTMLPIRFIAESFNLGVAWDGNTRTVSIIKNAFDEQEYELLTDILPIYSDKPYAEINNNIPFFKDYEIISGSFEYYSTLDELGRCDVCMASIGTDIMPTKKRESISSVTPSGWQSVMYDNIDGDYLYNRCHLIGFQLTGENANERNLITGTRYMNVDGMLPFENMICDYIKKTGNNVMYRVTPVFTDNNLVADGVLLEAYSIEDYGKGICLCVYCYNVQPNIKIDYATGNSSYSVTQSETNENNNISTNTVYRTPSGKRYHLDAECGGKNSYQVTLEDATNSGLTPCNKCAY